MGPNLPLKELGYLLVTWELIQHLSSLEAPGKMAILNHLTGR